jgi:predicted membrane-bound mannosyltransferase
MEWLGLFVMVMVVAAVVLAARLYAKSQEHEWHHDLGLWRGDRMRRRRPDGSWEYRPMTAAERADYDDMMAI